MAPPETGGGGGGGPSGSAGHGMTRKLGPLPLWAWAGAIGLGLVLLWRSRQASAQAASAAAPAPAGAVDTSNPQVDQSGALGGSSGFDPSAFAADIASQVIASTSPTIGDLTGDPSGPVSTDPNQPTPPSSPITVNIGTGASTGLHNPIDGGTHFPKPKPPKPGKPKPHHPDAKPHQGTQHEKPPKVKPKPDHHPAPHPDPEQWLNGHPHPHPALRHAPVHVRRPTASTIRH